MFRKLRDWMTRDEPRVGDRVYCERFGPGTLTRVMPTGWPALTPIKVGYVDFDGGGSAEIPMADLTLLARAPH